MTASPVDHSHDRSRPSLAARAARMLRGAADSLLAKPLDPAPVRHEAAVPPTPVPAAWPHDPRDRQPAEGE